MLLRLTGGSLCVAGEYFPKGETRVDEDRVSLDVVRDAIADVRWASLVDGPATEPAEPEPEPEPEPAEKALPTPAQASVAAADADEHLATRGEKLAELVENDGEADAPAPKVADGPFECPRCDKVLKTAQGLAKHVSAKHGDES